MQFGIFSVSDITRDPVSGETHRRHHVTPQGYYRGRKVIETARED